MADGKQILMTIVQLHFLFFFLSNYLIIFKYCTRTNGPQRWRGS